MGIQGIGRGPPPDIEARREKVAQAAMKTLDTDQSGGISKDEFLEGAGSSLDADKASAVYKAVDADESGAVSPDEIKAFMEKLASRRGPQGAQGGPPPGGAQGQQGGPPPGGGPEGGPPPGEGPEGAGADGASASSSTSSAKDPADTDGDGKVSEAERFAYGFKRMLSQLQKNDDYGDGTAEKKFYDVAA